MVHFTVDDQIRTLLALVLAELPGQVNRNIERMTLHILINDGEVLRVPSCEA